MEATKITRLGKGNRIPNRLEIRESMSDSTKKMKGRYW